ncbi:MAG: DUF4367 domain-containing protein [Oscillospiraceae bacterium]|nr:DUF4367 domain-containing protein [Oscillospiraceae bacterium]
MTNTTLSDILGEMCVDRAQAFKAFKCKRHFFSLRHRRAMKKIIRPKTSKFIPIRRRIAVLLIVVFIAVIGVSAGADNFSGLSTEMRKDGIHIVTADYKDSLQMIEYIYCLPEVPEGFVLTSFDTYDIISVETYMLNNQMLSLMQTIKSNFHQYLIDGQIPEEVDINGKRGYYYEDRYMGNIFWDNGDYILMVTGTLPKKDEPSGVFTKDDLVNLAKSVKVLK